MPIDHVLMNIAECARRRLRLRRAEDPSQSGPKVDAMKILAVLIVGGPLLAVSVAGAFSIALAGAPTEATQPPQLPAEADDFTARKDAYVRKAGDEMAEWQDKIRAAGEQAEVKGHEMSAEAKVQFNQIWTATQDGWRKLQIEGAEGWDESKRVYEQSVAVLRVQWQKVHIVSEN
jgi:hypothetical protein